MPSFVSGQPNYVANFQSSLDMNTLDGSNSNMPFKMSLSGDGHRMVLRTNQGVLAYYVTPLGYTQLGSAFTVTDYYAIGGICDGNPVIIYPNSFALSGDGKTAVAGRYDEGGYVGAQWIFVFDGVQFVNQGSKLIGSNYKFAQKGVYQGSSVAISNDGNTVISGGVNDANGVGAVWVFKRSGVQWSEVGKYSGTGNSMYQGSTVAISGDGTVAFWSSHGNNIGVWVKPLTSDGMFLIKMPSTDLFFKVNNDGRRLVTGGGGNDQNQLLSLDLDLVQLKVINSQQITNSAVTNDWSSENSFAMNSDGTVVAFSDNTGYFSVYINKDNEWSLSQHTILWNLNPFYRCSSSQQIALDATANTMILSYSFYCDYHNDYNTYASTGRATNVYSNHPLPSPSSALVPTSAPTNTSQFTTSTQVSTQVASVKPINGLEQSSFGSLSPITLAVVIVFSVFGMLLCALGIAYFHKKRTDDIVKAKQFVDWLGVNDSSHVNIDSGNYAMFFFSFLTCIILFCSCVKETRQLCRYQHGAPVEERASVPMNYKRNNNNNNNNNNNSSDP